MRINVSGIIFSHFSSLWDADKKLYSILDISIFFVVPLLIGFSFWYFCLVLTKDVFSLSISVFAIFSALLLSVQIGLFSLFQRKWDPPADQKKMGVFSSKLLLRKTLLRQLNVNISYLNVFSCFTIVVLIFFYSFNAKSIFESVSFSILFSHFILTLLMVIKRAHALFQAEYEAE